MRANTDMENDDKLLTWVAISLRRMGLRPKGSVKEPERV